MTPHDIEKALEVWTLQNLMNFSILLGFLALGLVVIQQYYRALRGRLTLRVSIELFDVVTTALVDVLLVAVVVIGLLVLNPDIMADIKIAIPFAPIATILFAIALCLRLFHGGHDLRSPAFMRVVWLMLAANVISIVGFTFVMEAPAGAFLAEHPSAFWTFLKTQLRSNANLELTQTTFLVCFPVLMIVFLWGFKSAIDQLKSMKAE